MLHGEGRGAFTIAISRADIARFQCYLWCADPTDQTHKLLLESPMKPELQQEIAVSLEQGNAEIKMTQVFSTFSERVDSRQCQACDHHQTFFC